MPNFIEVIKQLGIVTPFVYSAGIYTFFNYLDRQASEEAKRAISGWLQPHGYDRVAVAAAFVEIFDRLYTRPLLGWRAFIRSALFTTIITAIFLYEAAHFVGRATEQYMVVLLLANIVSDYISLFIVRKFLVMGGARPLSALIVGPLLGMCVVGLLQLVREFGLSYLEMMQLNISNMDLRDFVQNEVLPSFHGAFYRITTISALAVHLWLPLFAIGLLCLNGLNYFLLAIGRMQWFLKQGNDHPLDAVGYVLAVIVFIAMGPVQLFR